MLGCEIIVPGPQARTYSVRIGTDILGSLWQQLQSDFAGSNHFIITDANLIASGHLQTLVGARDVPAFVIDPPGEVSKT